MLSKKLDIPYNVYNESIFPILEKCFSEQYMVSKINENKFSFLRIFSSNSSTRESVRRLNTCDRGTISIEDRTIWMSLDVNRIIFATVLIDIMLVLMLVLIFSGFEGLFLLAVFLLVFVLTVAVWFDIIQEGNIFIDEKIEDLKNQLNNEG